MRPAGLLLFGLGLATSCWIPEPHLERGGVPDDGGSGSIADGGADALEPEPLDATWTFDAQPDAALPADATNDAGNCGALGERCCATEPACGFGDDFVQCDPEEQLCEACGHEDEECCRTGVECESGLFCVAFPPEEDRCIRS